MNTFRHRADRFRNKLTADYAEFRQCATQFGKEHDELLDLYLQLTELVGYPRREEYLDRFSDGVLTVTFQPRGEETCVLVSVFGVDDGAPLMEYSFRKNGRSSVYEPTEFMSTCVEFPDWDSGLRDLAEFLCMMFSEGLGDTSRFGSILGQAFESHSYQC